MDPLTLGAVAGASVIGGILGNIFSSGDRQKALDANQKSVQAWLDLNVPDPEQQKIVMQKFVQTGELDPKLESAVKQGASAYEKIQADPTYKSSQMRSLSSLEDIANQGGMNLSDRATLEKTLSDVNTADRGKREAIVDNMQRRGIGGSGLSLAAQLGSVQDASQRANEASLNAAASSRQRALDAIMAGGSLAGKLQDQDYRMKSDKAQAEDAISKFNAANLQGVNNANVGILNDAQKSNLALKQGVSDKNTALANEQQKYNKNLIQQQYENNVAKARGTSGAYGDLSSAYNNNANRTAGQFAAGGNAVGLGIGAASALSKAPSLAADGTANTDYNPADLFGSGEGPSSAKSWTGSDPNTVTDWDAILGKKDREYA